MRSIEQMQYWLTWVSLESGTEQDYLKGMSGSVRNDIRNIARSSWVTGQEANDPENVFLFHYEFFDVATDRLPDLDKLCDYIEEQSKKPQYRIRRSPVLQALVKEWSDKGRRSKFKDLANKVHSFDIQYIAGLRHMAEILDGKVPQIWIAVCNNNDALLFFTETEIEAASRFEVLTPKKEASVPVKVLVKMMALRLEQIRKAVNGENRGVLRLLKTEEEAKAEIASGVRNHLPVYFPNPKHRELIPLNDLNTVKAISVYKSIFVDRRIHLKSAGRKGDIFKQIHDLMQREFYDESVLRDAWNLVVVKEIHNS
jgi:hypothetical protein